jgi:hypothetical protein
MFMKINRIEADYLQDLVNEDWRKWYIKIGKQKRKVKKKQRD